MSDNNRLHAALLALLAALFLGAVYYIFDLRFGVGDIYAPYSSLRSDPLGTRVFYESLSRLDGVIVDRHFEPPEKLETGEPATLFFLGTIPAAINFVFYGERLEALERLARDGGRIVVAFHHVKKAAPPEKSDVPGRTLESGDETEAASDEAASTGGKSEPEYDIEDGPSDDETAEASGTGSADIDGAFSTRRWGFGYRLDKTDVGARFARPTEIAREAGISDVMRLRTGLRFAIGVRKLKLSQTDGAGWEALYVDDAEETPVVIRRSFGKGEVVLLADAYWLSNEAMLKERNTPLLAWLAGDAGRVVFDEFFHGVRKEEGIAGLIRKYRLHGLMAGLLVLAVLFIWRNASHFVPPDPEAVDEADGVAGRRDATDGLISLLRRNVPGREMPSVCWREWQKGADAGLRRLPKSAKAEIERIVAAESAKADPVAAYRKVWEILARHGVIRRRA